MQVGSNVTTYKYILTVNYKRTGICSALYFPKSVCSFLCPRLFVMFSVQLKGEQRQDCATLGRVSYSINRIIPNMPPPPFPPFLFFFGFYP